MRYLLALIVLVPSIVFGDTKSEAIIDCDKQRSIPLTCLACNIYHEAVGEPTIGQLVIASVTKNRVESKLYPNNYCKVVWEARRDYRTKKLVAMFSWTRDGKHDKVYNKAQWKSALILAKQMIELQIPDVTLGALWYHSTRINPYWAKHYYPSIRIGGHQFYVASEEDFLVRLTENALHFTTIKTIASIKETVD